MKITKLTKTIECTCDFCGKSSKDMDMGTWFVFIETEGKGLRLFEKLPEKSHYESFHIPNKVEKTYCSKDCAMNSMVKSVELFLSEVKFKPRDMSKTIPLQ